MRILGFFGLFFEAGVSISGDFIPILDFSEYSTIPKTRLRFFRRMAKQLDRGFTFIIPTLWKTRIYLFILAVLNS